MFKTESIPVNSWYLIVKPPWESVNMVPVEPNKYALQRGASLDGEGVDLGFIFTATPERFCCSGKPIRISANTVSSSYKTHHGGWQTEGGSVSRSVAKGPPTSPKNIHIFYPNVKEKDYLCNLHDKALNVFDTIALRNWEERQWFYQRSAE